MNAPRLREPRTFYDVFTITSIAVALTAGILHVANSHLVRVETVAFVTLVLPWDVRAITNVLEHAEP